jgi:hAT family C-terminal dimerisation region
VVIPVPTTIPFSYENQNQAEPRKLNTFNRIILSFRSVTRPVNEDEYEDYNSQKSYESGKKRALAWWYRDTQKQRWPRLSLMAIDILSIPLMSDKPEKVFSEAHRTVSWDRGQREPETIEMRECLKYWGKKWDSRYFL